MRFRPDEPGESVLLKSLRLKVDVLQIRVPAALIVIGRHWVVAAWLVEVGVRHVPLALPVRVVTGGPKPVAHGGNGGGIQPVQILFDCRLGCSGCLRDSVERRVLTGVDRCPTGLTRS